MSDKLHEPAKRLPYSKVNTERIRATIAKNLHRLESELDGYDWLALWDAPRLLGIKDDDLVFLLVCRLVPSPELVDGGLYFYRPSLLASLYRVADTARPVAYLACTADGSLETPDDGEGEQ